MNIKIDDEYTLQSDDRNIILVRTKQVTKGENAGGTYEQNVSYLGSIQSALKDYLRIKINTSEATSIQELLNEVKEIKKTINNVLGGI